MPINAMDGPHIWLPQMCDSVPLRTQQQLVDYAKRLTRVPLVVDQEIEQMRLGLKAGRVPPRVVLSKAVQQVLEQASFEIENDPTKSPFFKPFQGAGGGRWQTDEVAVLARNAIAGGITPSFKKL